jgi:hypothetical protein
MVYQVPGIKVCNRWLLCRRKCLAPAQEFVFRGRNGRLILVQSKHFANLVLVHQLENKPKHGLLVSGLAEREDKDGENSVHVGQKIQEVPLEAKKSEVHLHVLGIEAVALHAHGRGEEAEGQVDILGLLREIAWALVKRNVLTVLGQSLQKKAQVDTILKVLVEVLDGPGSCPQLVVYPSDEGLQGPGRSETRKGLRSAKLLYACMEQSGSLHRQVSLSCER